MATELERLKKILSQLQAANARGQLNDAIAKTKEAIKRQEPGFVAPSLKEQTVAEKRALAETRGTEENKQKIEENRISRATEDRKGFVQWEKDLRDKLLKDNPNISEVDAIDMIKGRKNAPVKGLSGGINIPAQFKLFVERGNSSEDVAGSNIVGAEEFRDIYKNWLRQEHFPELEKAGQAPTGNLGAEFRDFAIERRDLKESTGIDIVDAEKRDPKGSPTIPTTPSTPTTPTAPSTPTLGAPISTTQTTPGGVGFVDPTVSPDAVQPTTEDSTLTKDIAGIQSEIDKILGEEVGEFKAPDAPQLKAFDPSTAQPFFQALSKAEEPLEEQLLTKLRAEEKFLKPFGGTSALKSTNKLLSNILIERNQRALQLAQEQFGEQRELEKARFGAELSQAQIAQQKKLADRDLALLAKERLATFKEKIAQGISAEERDKEFKLLLEGLQTEAQKRQNELALQTQKSAQELGLFQQKKGQDFASTEATKVRDFQKSLQPEEVEKPSFLDILASGVGAGLGGVAGAAAGKGLSKLLKV